MGFFDRMVRVYVVALALLAVVVFSKCACGLECAAAQVVNADVERPTAAQLRLALAVAKTAANEAGMRSPNDTRLIYDATRGHGLRDDVRHRWLVRHSACVNGGDCNRDGVVDVDDERAADARPGNARWTRHLEWGDRKPEGWPDAARWRPEVWRRLRVLSLALVMRDELTGVCGDVVVVTWGLLSAFNRNPDLVPVDCGGANLGGRRRAAAFGAARARPSARLASVEDPG